MGLTGLKGLGIKLKDLQGDLQGSKDSRAFQVEVYDKSESPVLHHREVTELKKVGDQILEHTVIVPADVRSGRRVIRDVIADAATGKINSIQLSNEKGQLTKTLVRINGGADVKFEIEEFDAEEGYVKHKVIVDEQNRPSFEETKFQEYYPRAGKVRNLKALKTTTVEYAEDGTVEAEFVRNFHYAPDGRTELDGFVENTITPLSFRKEDLREIKETHREISDDGRRMTAEGVTEVYILHDSSQLQSSKRWREVSGKARRGNNLLRLETTERKIKFGKDGEKAADESKTTRWQYNEEDLPISVEVTSGLEPDYANYVFYKPDQKIPYARLRWDFHEQKYILYTSGSEVLSDGHNHELDSFQSLDWNIKWKVAQEKEAGRVNLTPDYAAADKIMQDMMASPSPSHTD